MHREDHLKALEDDGHLQSKETPSENPTADPWALSLDSGLQDCHEIRVCCWSHQAVFCGKAAWADRQQWMLVKHPGVRAEPWEQQEHPGEHVDYYGWGSFQSALLWTPRSFIAASLLALYPSFSSLPRPWPSCSSWEALPTLLLPLKQPDHVFLLPHQQSTDLTPALSAPSCHPAPPKKTWKPHSSTVTSGLKTPLYLPPSIPSMWTQPMCSPFISSDFYKEF